MKIDLKITEKQIMNGLKDFQRATVERVFSLFKNGQNRVLVADEEGPAQTWLPKSFAKTAGYHQEEGDTLSKWCISALTRTLQIKILISSK